MKKPSENPWSDYGKNGNPITLNKKWTTHLVHLTAGWEPYK